MKYEWDETKRQENIQKHGWDFADAQKAWDSGAPVVPNYSERRGEDRYEVLGKVEAKTVFIVYEDKGDDLRRIISFRKANKEERQIYELESARELGREDKGLNKLFEQISQERQQAKELDRKPLELEKQDRRLELKPPTRDDRER